MRSCGLGDWFSEIFRPRTEATNEDALPGGGNGGGVGGVANGRTCAKGWTARIGA